MGARLAIVVGRFLPVHVGHVALFALAHERCEALLVVIRATSRDAYPASLRATWVEATTRAPTVVAIEHDDRRLDASARTHVDDWARRVKSHVPPHLASAALEVLSGDPHTAPLAVALGAAFTLVDRGAIDVSGTDIRADPRAFAHALPDAVRPHVLSLAPLEARSSG